MIETTTRSFRDLNTGGDGGSTGGTTTDGDIHGVDVVLEATRTRIRALLVDRPGRPSRYVGEDGIEVYRWVFDEPATHIDGLSLSAVFEGEPIRLARVRPLSLGAAAETPPSLSPDERRNTLRDLYNKRRACLERHGDTERLFFLELDRATSWHELPDSMRGVLPKSAIDHRVACLRGVQHGLERRMRWRIAGHDALFHRVRFDGAQVVAVSDVMMHEMRVLADATGVPDPRRVRDAFVHFAAGRLTAPAGAPSNGHPDGAFFFLFADFALVAAATPHPHQAAWAALVGPLTMAQRVYVHAHGSPPKPFTAWDGTRVRELLDEECGRLTATWDMSDDLAGWESQFRRNAWEAFRGVFTGGGRTDRPPGSRAPGSGRFAGGLLGPR